MTNSYVGCLESVLRGVFESLIRDTMVLFPSDRRGLEQDLARVLYLVDHRGIGVFTLDFPAALKHFDSCLSAGAYTPSRLACMRTKKGAVIPLLLGQILLRVFDHNGMLRSNADTQAIAAYRQLLAFGKKVKLECAEERTEDVVQTFYRVDQDLEPATLPWESHWNFSEPAYRDLHLGDLRNRVDSINPSTRILPGFTRKGNVLPDREDLGSHHQVCQSVADILSVTLGTFNPMERRPRHGPGAVADLRRGDYKYLFPSWPDRLESVFPFADLAYANYGLWVDDLQTSGPRYEDLHQKYDGGRSGRSPTSLGHHCRSDGRRRQGNEEVIEPTPSSRRNLDAPHCFGALSRVSGMRHGSRDHLDVSTTEAHSRLISVPKTQKGPRLIAAEPTAHMWCQQLIWDHIRNVVPQTWIGKFVKFDDQTFNQEGARLASQTGEEWTVDLSMASDRLSLWVVERIFRRNPSLLDALRASRTAVVDNGIEGYLTPSVALKKFATMGSACTFPVQTLVFLSFALAACLIAHGLRPSERNIRRFAGRVRVFGDDVIIPKEAGDIFERLLGYHQLVVNQAKTHRTGKFRESCGLEAFDGNDVTPSYVLTAVDTRAPLSKPETLVSVVESSNNFFRRGWWQAAEHLRATVTAANIAVVPAGSGAFGFVTFCDGVRAKSFRTNKFLHRREFSTLRLKSRVANLRSHSSAALLQYFTEEPDPLLVWESGAKQRPRLSLRRGWVGVPAPRGAGPSLEVLT